jgi:phage tail-like protein
VRRWNLQRAFPSKWTGPDLKSDKGAVAVETLEITHEGLLPAG